MSGASNKELIAKLEPNIIDKLTNIEFIPPDSKPIGASSVYVASTCANFMVSSWVQGSVLNSPDIPSRLIFYLTDYSIDKWKMEVDPACIICRNHNKS